jgi:hypothetical protein
MVGIGVRTRFGLIAVSFDLADGFANIGWWSRRPKSRVRCWSPVDHGDTDAAIGEPQNEILP